ncbi:MAG: hypothetical protein AAGG44_14990, partial [Planctomycetota bacterium]
LEKTLSTLESVLPGMKSQLDLALRHGAATQQALADAKEGFGKFVREHTESLVSEPIPLPN